jgi:hypothetical protein
MSLQTNSAINPNEIFAKPLNITQHTTQFRDNAYRGFCQHIATGKAVESYVHAEGGAVASYRTILKWMQDERTFPPEYKVIATSMGLGFWENVVAESALGINTKANVASLQMLMRNKYGWDRRDDERKTAEPEILASYEKLMVQLTKRQKSFPEIEQVSSFNLSAAADTGEQATHSSEGAFQAHPSNPLS